MTTPKPLVLPSSEYFLIARCVNRQGFPLELGVIVSYLSKVGPQFMVSNWKSETGDEVDAFTSEYADDALDLYNSILLGDAR